MNPKIQIEQFGKFILLRILCKKSLFLRLKIEFFKGIFLPERFIF